MTRKCREREGSDVVGSEYRSRSLIDRNSRRRQWAPDDHGRLSVDLRSHKSCDDLHSDFERPGSDEPRSKLGGGMQERSDYDKRKGTPNVE